MTAEQEWKLDLQSENLGVTPLTVTDYPKPQDFLPSLWAGFPYLPNELALPIFQYVYEVNEERQV